MGANLTVDEVQLKLSKLQEETQKVSLISYGLPKVMVSSGVLFLCEHAGGFEIVKKAIWLIERYNRLAFGTATIRIKDLRDGNLNISVGDEFQVCIDQDRIRLNHFPLRELELQYVYNNETHEKNFHIVSFI